MLTDTPYTYETIKEHVGRVEGMRSLRLFLHDTMGERIMSFWLESKRFQRNVEQGQKRLVFREIQEKYLKSGSPFELPELIKWRLLCGGPASKDPRSFRHQGFCRQTYEMCSSIIPEKVLLEVQEMIVERLRAYWLPKYLLHRVIVRQRATQRWRHSFQGKGIGSGKNDRKSIAELTRELVKHRKLEAINEAAKNEQKEIDDVMERSRVSSTESIEGQAPLEKEKEREQRREQWRKWFWGPVDGEGEEVTELPANLPPVLMFDEVHLPYIHTVPYA